MPLQVLSEGGSYLLALNFTVALLEFVSYLRTGLFPGFMIYFFYIVYRTSSKVSRAIFNNLGLLGTTNFQGFKDFYLINKPFCCDYVLRAAMYQGRISIQEIRYVKK